MPLVIDGDVDHARIRILVDIPARHRHPVPRGLLLLSGALLVWSHPVVAAGLVMACAAWSLFEHLPVGQGVLELRADRTGVTRRGRSATLTFDYFAVVVDGIRYPVVGGLSRAEHGRLQGVVRPSTAPGTEAAVPEALRRRDEQRTHSGRAEGSVER